MGDLSPEKRNQLIVRIASASTSSEKDALRIWIERLLELRASNLPDLRKAKEAISITASSGIIRPTVKLIARETKRVTWDERGVKGRMGIVGAVAGLAMFGGQGAGIAALGTAIGVPLWVVFGAGATFVGALYEEITGKKPK